MHDWLTGMRGGEQVLEAICSIFPGAEIFTLFYFPRSVSQEIESHRIHTSFLQHLPGIKRFHRYFLPLFPTAIESFNLSGYDLVISLSHCVAKGVITPVNSTHVSYMFTPMRYAWDMSGEYFESGKVPGANKIPVSFFLNYLRMWDVTSMQRIDNILTISQFVAKRLKKYFKVDATVIYPPVDTDFFVPGERDDEYYLVVSALAPYKMIENAIFAINKLKRKLIVVGTGQMEKKLKSIAGPEVEFTGWLPRERVRELMQGCSAFIMPGVEDFGIAPVEAQSCGKPVIAFGEGGANETVIPLGNGDAEPTGILFKENTVESLIEGIFQFENNRDKFEPSKIRMHALKFSKQRFLQEFLAILDKVLTNKNSGLRKNASSTYA